MIQKNKDKKYVLVSDFDGTISKNDFFRHVIENLLSEKDIEPWEQYKAGKITHVKGLSLIFNKIRLKEDEFNKFIDSIQIEEYFTQTVSLCKEMGIDFYVVSAGADYYIKRLLNNLNVLQQVKLFANPSYFSEEEGLKMQPPPKSTDYYDEDLGISKKYFVLKLKNEGYTVIFAGDGTPDIEAAKAADIVFAKDYLVTLCKKENVKHIEYSSYQDIYNYILNC